MSMALEEESEIGAALADHFFSCKEKTDLEQLQDLRFSLINILTKDEDGKLAVPGKTAEKVLLTDLINNASKDIKDRAKLRISSKATESEGINRAAIAEVLRRHRVASSIPSDASERTLPDSIKPQNVVPGETSVGVEIISIHEILGA